MNIFNNIQKGAFAVITNTFGYNATWNPLDGSEQKNARVLYKDPTENQKLGGHTFETERYVMEYLESELPGLKQSTDRGEFERVRIETAPGVVLTFVVKGVRAKFDGKTIEAYLNPVNE